MTFEELWRLVHDACPSPSWTVVAVEYDNLDAVKAREAALEAAGVPDAMDHVPAPRWWWIYVEPGNAEEPDAERRISRRINWRGADRNEGFLTLAGYIAKVYPPKLIGTSGRGLRSARK